MSSKDLVSLLPEKHVLKIIETKPELIDWPKLSANVKLSEEFIDNYRNKVDWYYISKFQKLSEPFIEKHKDRVNWHHIS